MKKTQTLPVGATRLLDERFSVESVVATIHAGGCTIYVVDNEPAVTGAAVVVVPGGPSWLRAIVWAEGLDVVAAMKIATRLFADWLE